MLKKLGNPTVRHNFRLANMVADVLSKIGEKLTLPNQPHMLLSPPEAVKDYLKADLGVALSSKLILWSTCNKLACNKLARFGNRLVFSSTSTDVMVNL